MKKLLKIFVGLLAVVVVILIALAILVKLYVTPERVKAVVLPLVEQKIHRQVTLGDVKVGLFSGIELHDLKVAGRDGEGPLLTVDLARLRFQLLPLLAKRVIVDELRLERPRVNLGRDAAGELSVSDLLVVAAGGGAPAGQPSAGTEGTPISLLISDLRITNGEAVFVDHQPDPAHPGRIQLTGLEVTAAGLVLSGDLPVKLKGMLNGAPLTVNGTLRLKDRGGRFAIDLQGLDAVPLAPYFREKLPGTLTSLKIDLEADVDRSAREIVASGTLTGRDLSVRLTALPDAPISDAAMRADFDLTSRPEAHEIDVRKLVLDVNGSMLSLAGSLTMLDTAPRGDLALTIPGLDLQKAAMVLPAGLLGNLKDISPSGVVRADFRLNGELAKPLALLKEGSITMEQVQGTVMGVRPSINGRLQLADGNLRVERLAAAIGELRADITGTVSQLLDGPRADLSVTVPRVELAAALAKAPPQLVAGVASLAPAGHVEAFARLAGPLAAPAKLLQSASVTLSGVRINAGGQQPIFNGRLSLKGDQLASDGLFVELAGNRADLDVTAGNLFGTPKVVKANVTSRRFLIEPLLQGGGGAAAATGKVTASTPSGDLGPFDLPLQASGTIRIGETVWKGLAVSDFVADYALRDNQFSISRMTGKVAGGTFSNTAQVDLRQPGLSYAAALNLSGVQADSFMSALVPEAAGTLFGTLQLQSSINGRGTEWQAISRSLTGNAVLELADGRMVSPSLVKGFAAFLRLPEMNEMPFSDFQGKSRIVNGKAEIEGALISRQLKLFPRGVVGLDGRLALVMDTRLSPELTARIDQRANATRYLLDADGWSQVPLLVSGTLQAPQFGLDPKGVQALATRALQQELQRGLDKLAPKPKPAPQDAGPVPPADQTQAPPETGDAKSQPQPAPVRPGQRLLEDALQKVLKH